jgi:hypothetical protein
MEDRLTRHRRVLESLGEEGAEMTEQAEAYLEALTGDLDPDTFLEDAAESFEAIESALDEAEAATLSEADIYIDGEILEGPELLSLDAAADPAEAHLLIDSPLVNRMRGGSQELVLADETTYRFRIAKTLVAEVAEDNTGKLELVLELFE